MSKPGPRIHVKTDAESSIGRGCVLYGAHSRPEIAAMDHAMCAATSKLYPRFLVIRKTEGWRPQREAGKRDLHTEMRAIDYTVETETGFRATEQELRNIAFKAKETLGDDYDVEVHAVGSDAVHIHAELDPR